MWLFLRAFLAQSNYLTHLTHLTRICGNPPGQAVLPPFDALNSPVGRQSPEQHVCGSPARQIGPRPDLGHAPGLTRVLKSSNDPTAFVRHADIGGIAQDGPAAGLLVELEGLLGFLDITPAN